MTNDERDKALAELLPRVDEVADGEPSLDALYGLESAFKYSDFWVAAHERLRDEITRRGQQTAWVAELRRPPPDLKSWASFIRRREINDAAIQGATEAWNTKAPERMFAPHHDVAGITEGAAALHVTLLSDLDPVAAVEYVAALPNEHFIWPAAHRVQIAQRPDLVERVLVGSKSLEAALLCLACELDAQRGLVWKLGNDARWHAGEPAGDEARAALEVAWSATIPQRFQTIAKAIVARSDASVVVGSLMRHLVRSSVRTSTQDHDDRVHVIRIALDAILAALPGTTFESERASRLDAACVVSRILIADHRGEADTYWNEWLDLVKAEESSLDDDNEIYWAAAGKSLRAAGDPFEVWTRAVRQLEPRLRERARRIGRGVDPGVHLIMPAVNAAAAMGADGTALWWSVYERARRHFFVDAPADNEFGYRLCAYVFGAFPRVFGDDAETLKSALALLPTQDHVAWATAQLPANRGKRPEADSANQAQDDASPTQIDPK